MDSAKERAEHVMLIDLERNDLGRVCCPGTVAAVSYTHLEDRITTQFLISSDFFANGADTSRRVTYLGYYDPMIACKNPFYRRLDTGSGA